MSGSFTPVRGATGPAPNIPIFGMLPDRLNMLRPWRPNQGIVLGVYDQPFAANFLNQFVIYNLQDGAGSNTPTGTFGAFTTAPDGTTNTAQLFVEATANTQHQAWAGFQCQAFMGPMRLTGYFKSSTRRVELVLQNDPNLDTTTTHLPLLQTGVKCVFDLVGGRIGVGPTSVGGATIIGAEIVPHPQGNGWYKCTVDAQAGGTIVWGTVILDNGVGLGAESITYAGDGTSGVYGWRVNIMPIPAYGMNSVQFFEGWDDPTLSNVDLADNGLGLPNPAKTWFIRHRVPRIPYTSNTDGIGDMSGATASGSILTLPGGHNGSNIPMLQTFAANSRTAPSTYVGQGWVPPALFEAYFSYDFFQPGFDPGQTGAFWSWAIEDVCGQPFGTPINNGTFNPFLTGRELDFFEDRSGTAPRLSTVGSYEVPPNPATQNSGVGTSTIGHCDMYQGLKPYGQPPWNGGRQWNAGDSCFNAFDGKFYTALGTNTNVRPDTSLGAQWALYTGHTPAVVNDPGQLNLYSCLVLPYSSGKGGMIGMMVGFYNGIFNQSHPIVSWYPQEDRSFFTPYMSLQSNDWQHLPVIINSGNFTTYNFDYIKVTQ